MFFFLISPSPGVSERASLFSSSSRFWHSSIFYFLFKHHRYFLESDIWDGYIFHVSLLYLNFSFCISLILEIPRGVDIFEFGFSICHILIWYLLPTLFMWHSSRSEEKIFWNSSFQFLCSASNPWGAFKNILSLQSAMKIIWEVTTDEIYLAERYILVTYSWSI